MCVKRIRARWSSAAGMQNPFRYFNSSPEIIRLAVMMYVRFPLSLRQVEDLLSERGIDICHETVRFWWNRFGPLFAAEIRKRRVHRLCYSNWRWHLDEVFVRINGKTHYLWRAVDHEGEVLEVFATKRRDRRAAFRFLKCAIKRSPILGFGIVFLSDRWPRARHRSRFFLAGASRCQRRRKNVPARRRKSVPRARWQLVPVVHGRDPRAGRCALRAAGGGPRVGEWNGRLPPLMPAVGRVEVDPHGPTASKCQGGRFGVFPGKPEGPR